MMRFIQIVGSYLYMGGIQERMSILVMQNKASSGKPKLQSQRTLVFRNVFVLRRDAFGKANETGVSQKPVSQIIVSNAPCKMSL